MGSPDPRHVFKDADDDMRILGALMFKENVDFGGFALDEDREEQVSLRVFEVGIDKLIGLEFETAPVDGGGDLTGELGPEKTGSVFWVAEGDGKKFVVRLVKAGVRSVHKLGIGLKRIATT